MFARRPIRSELQIGIATVFVIGIILLLTIMAILAFSSFRGAYAYRGLARSVSRRAAELPQATVLAQRRHGSVRSRKSRRRADARSSRRGFH